MHQSPTTIYYNNASTLSQLKYSDPTVKKDKYILSFKQHSFKIKMDISIVATAEYTCNYCAEPSAQYYSNEQSAALEKPG